MYVSVTTSFGSLAAGWKHFLVTLNTIEAEREGRRHLKLEKPEPTVIVVTCTCSVGSSS